MDIYESIKQEKNIKEKIDKKGRRWIKVYFGGRQHFKNWLEQCIEINGSKNVKIEEIPFIGSKCYREMVKNYIDYGF